MSDTVNITKGTRIRVQSMTAYLPCLAGMQMKFGVKTQDFTGVVRHVRGDHPTNPTQIRFYVDPDGDAKDFNLTRPPGCTCASAHVDVDPKHVVGVVP